MSHFEDFFMGQREDKFQLAEPISQDQNNHEEFIKTTDGMCEEAVSSQLS
tara:strand:- start:620 stop:769 length:150 start_codon:yes stop_codon:yes gene_type:complete